MAELRELVRPVLLGEDVEVLAAVVDPRSGIRRWRIWRVIRR